MEYYSKVHEFSLRSVNICEMLFGQPEDYYQRMYEAGQISQFCFKTYYMLITGLPCLVYRKKLGIDAFEYTEYYLEAEREIRRALEMQNVNHLLAMILYDQSKRICIMLDASSGAKAMEIAQIVSRCINQIYAIIISIAL